MRCNDHRAKFTDRYEGTLSPASLRDLEAHCQSCSACGSEWTNYLQAVEALRTKGVPSVPDDYVDGIVAAALEEQESGLGSWVVPGPRRISWGAPRWSHGLSAALGAALALLFVQPTPPTGLQDKSTTDPSAQAEGSPESGALVRIPVLPLDGSGLPGIAPAGTQGTLAESPAPGGPESPAGDRGIASPELTGPGLNGVDVDGAELAGIGRPGTRSEDTTSPEQRKPRVVHRAVFLPIPVPYEFTPPTPAPAPRPRPVDLRPLERAVAFTGEAILQLNQTLERGSDRLIAQLQVEQAAARWTETAPDPVETDPILVADARPPLGRETGTPSSRSHRSPSTLAIQRRDGQVTLSTSGTLQEVVPALIARIDDEDPAIRELAQIRLEEIWSERTGTAFSESPLSLEEEALDLRDVGWRRFVRHRDTGDEEPTMSELWTTWWSEEQTTLASATF